ncbi:MAG: hypothetical protein ACTS4W_01275 [Candidatus Hodgkinia cicadicola]
MRDLGEFANVLAEIKFNRLINRAVVTALQPFDRATSMGKGFTNLPLKAKLNRSNP